MNDSDYKKYSLEKLEEWIHDSLSTSKASPKEIYDVIHKVVEENYYTYKHQTSRAYELLALLNGNGQSYENVLRKNEYYNYTEYELEHQKQKDKILFGCNKDDPSPECQGAWNSFWEEQYHPEKSSQYTEEELNAMCDKAASDYEKETCREYNLREAEYYDKRAQLDAKCDKVKKWSLPVQQKIEDGVDDYYVQFPDDLLEAADLKEGDQIIWIDNNDGSYTLQKVTDTLSMDEC
jgi:hypothetical protein